MRRPSESPPQDEDQNDGPRDSFEGADLDAYTILFRESAVMMHAIDADGVVRDVNDRWLEVMGYARDEVVGRRSVDFLDPDCRRPVLERYLPAVAERGYVSNLELRFRRKDGSPLDVLLCARLLRDADGRFERMLATLVDITDRKRIERQLAGEHELRRSIIDRAAEGLSVGHPVSDFPHVRFTVWNDRMTEITGYTMEEINRLGWYEALYPDTDLRERARRRVERMREGDELRRERWQITRADGRPRIVDISTSLLRTSEGAQHVLALMEDVTERLEASAELERNAKLLAQTEKAARVGGWEMDLASRRMYLSQEVYRILGTAPGRLKADADSLRTLIVPEWLPVLEEKVRASLGGGEPFDVEFEICDLRAERIWIRCVGLAQIENGTAVRLYGAIQHIHDRKQLELQLLLAQRLESVGRLAGGVAHDFNNLLMSLLGYWELATMEVEEGTPIQRYLERIRDAAQRGAGLTRQLLAFARKQVSRPRVVSLNDTVRHGLDLVRRLIGEDIELVDRLDPAAGCVEIDPGQFEQVLMNLAINARDAMPEGGSVLVETTTESVGKAAARTLGVPSGVYVRVTVSDTGPGIPSETLPHLFEPFFTTKPVGQGTGLGLSTCYGIVKQCGGSISAANRAEGGATFRILLPLAKGVAAPVAGEGAADVGGSETILVVEDDESIRGLVADALRRRGYVVLEAADGMEALHKATTNIDLLITDVVMPRMGGKQLADTLRRDNPGLRVLYSSGYTEDPSVVADASGHFLEKPYTSRELSAKVREILGESGGSEDV